MTYHRACSPVGAGGNRRQIHENSPVSKWRWPRRTNRRPSSGACVVPLWDAKKITPSGNYREKMKSLICSESHNEGGPELLAQILTAEGIQPPTEDCVARAVTLRNNNGADARFLVVAPEALFTELISARTQEMGRNDEAAPLTGKSKFAWLEAAHRVVMYRRRNSDYTTGEKLAMRDLRVHLDEIDPEGKFADVSNRICLTSVGQKMHELPKAHEFDSEPLEASESTSLTPAEATYLSDILGDDWPDSGRNYDLENCVFDKWRPDKRRLSKWERFFIKFCVGAAVLGTAAAVLIRRGYTATADDAPRTAAYYMNGTAEAQFMPNATAETQFMPNATGDSETIVDIAVNAAVEWTKKLMPTPSSDGTSGDAASKELAVIGEVTKDVLHSMTSNVKNTTVPMVDNTTAGSPGPPYVSPLRETISRAALGVIVMSEDECKKSFRSGKRREFSDKLDLPRPFPCESGSGEFLCKVNNSSETACYNFGGPFEQDAFVVEDAVRQYLDKDAKCYFRCHTMREALKHLWKQTKERLPHIPSGPEPYISGRSVIYPDREDFEMMIATRYPNQKGSHDVSCGMAWLKCAVRAKLQKFHQTIEWIAYNASLNDVFNSTTIARAKEKGYVTRDCQFGCRQLDHDLGVAASKGKELRVIDTKWLVDSMHFMKRISRRELKPLIVPWQSCRTAYRNRDNDLKLSEFGASPCRGRNGILACGTYDQCPEGPCGEFSLEACHHFGPAWTFDAHTVRDAVIANTPATHCAVICDSEEEDLNHMWYAVRRYVRPPPNYMSGNGFDANRKEFDNAVAAQYPDTERLRCASCFCNIARVKCMVDHGWRPAIESVGVDMRPYDLETWMSTYHKPGCMPHLTCLHECHGATEIWG